MELQWKTADLPSLKLYHFISSLQSNRKLTFVCLAFTCEYLGTRQQDTSRAKRMYCQCFSATVHRKNFCAILLAFLDYEFFPKWGLLLKICLHGEQVLLNCLSTDLKLRMEQKWKMAEMLPMKVFLYIFKLLFKS